jgi:hypothetical protein
MSRISDDFPVQNVDKPDIVKVFRVYGATMGPMKPRTSVEPFLDDSGV